MNMKFSKEIQQHWDQQKTIDDILRERLGLGPDQDPEAHLDKEVVTWITTARLKEFKKEYRNDLLGALGFSLMMVSLVHLAMYFIGGPEHFTETSKVVLILVPLFGVIPFLFAMDAKYKRAELPDEEILKAMKPGMAKQQMRVLLDIKNDFRAGRLALVCWNEPTKKYQSVSSDFEKRNALNLLLPRLGNNKLVHGFGYTKDYQFAVFETPEYTVQQTEREDKQRVPFPKNKKGRFLSELRDDELFGVIEALSCAKNRRQKARFHALRLARMFSIAQPDLTDDALAGLVAEDQKVRVSPGTIVKIISGRYPEFEKDIVFPNID